MAVFDCVCCSATIFDWYRLNACAITLYVSVPMVTDDFYLLAKRICYSFIFCCKGFSDHVLIDIYTKFMYRNVAPLL